jgi:1-acyl-sn-glycerol-3-phosphate acyltransferase
VNEKIRYKIATLSQIIWWPTFWFIAYFIVRAEVEDNLSLPKDANARFIIAANHQSKLDPFVITGIIKPRFWRRLLPYRYITANQFLYSYLYIWLLWPLGGFPAYKTEREGWGLKHSELIHSMGQTLCIFPEGQRSKPNEIKPKHGLARIASLPNTYVIPINLQWYHNPRRVKVIIGSSYNADGLSSDEILKNIYNLSSK